MTTIESPPTSIRRSGARDGKAFLIAGPLSAMGATNRRSRRAPLLSARPRGGVRFFLGEGLPLRWRRSVQAIAVRPMFALFANRRPSVR